MHICFGAVASILNCCRKGINQSDFIARIAYCLDKKSSYFTENYSSLENKKEIKGDDPAANKLLRCKRDYVLYSKDIPYTISYPKSSKTSKPTCNLGSTKIKNLQSY